MRNCDCHDHPLEHAIWQALDAFDNGRPRVSVGAIVGQLRQDLRDWQDEQAWDREQRYEEKKRLHGLNYGEVRKFRDL